MSLKGVELQIAIPRTSEVTAVQNHLNQKPTHDQAALAQQALKAQHQKVKRSSEVGESAFTNIKDSREEGQGSSRRFAPKGKAESVEGLTPPETGHPYKGKHIDISL